MNYQHKTYHNLKWKTIQWREYCLKWELGDHVKTSSELVEAQGSYNHFSIYAVISPDFVYVIRGKTKSPFMYMFQVVTVQDQARVK